MRKGRRKVAKENSLEGEGLGKREEEVGCQEGRQGSVLSYSNLALTSHTSYLNLDKARLVYGLVMKMDMNIGALISRQISLIAQSNSSRLGFPGLITALC